jgi:hypothetical protein
MKNHHVETECIPRERFSPLAELCLSAPGGTRSTSAGECLISERQPSRSKRHP